MIRRYIDTGCNTLGNGETKHGAICITADKQCVNKNLRTATDDKDPDYIFATSPQDTGSLSIGIESEPKCNMPEPMHARNRQSRDSAISITARKKPIATRFGTVMLARIAWVLTKVAAIALGDGELCSSCAWKAAHQKPRPSVLPLGVCSSCDSTGCCSQF